MQVFDRVISDRGSRYAVSGGACKSEREARDLIKQLCRNRKFAKATHHSWAFIGATGPVKNDDGESGAGAIILRMLAAEGVNEHIVVVTRWYGGKNLGGDRFRHISHAVRYYLDHFDVAGAGQ